MDKTNAERQRRYIARLKERSGAVSNTTDTVQIITLKKELAEAKARIEELAFELVQAQAVKPRAKRSKAVG
jgi:hypothetical protein